MEITLYHGSNCIIKQPEIRAGRYTKDFGMGFYCTKFRKQAVRWAKRLAAPGVPGVLNLYTYDEQTQLKTLAFPTADDSWLDFVVSCRAGVPHEFDVVTGPMADDTIYSYIDDFISGTISRRAFWELIRFKYPTHQTCFCTEQGLAHLKFISAEAVS